MKTKFYILWLIHFCVLIIFSAKTEAQISGFVFRDINNDGIRQTVSPSEPAEYGVTVRAYNAANMLIGSTTTAANGRYSFSSGVAPSGLAVRLEFIVKGGDQPSKRMAAGRSNIQFVVAGPSTNNADFALASKKTFSDNSNPYVATTAYTNGDPNSTGTGSAGERDNLIVFPYDMSNDGGSTRRVKNQHLGSIFGLSWQRESRTLFMAAYLKRHAGFGPHGIGAIYRTQVSQTGVPGTPSLLVDVKTIGINVGNDPRKAPLPAAAATPNTDEGVFAEVGKNGIGGIDLTNDGRDLYLVNMHEKKLHRINIGNPIKTSITAADVTGTWNIPDPGIAGTAFYPMAVEVYNDKVYVGGVATRETTIAHSMNDTINLRGIVYELDPNDAVPSFREVLRFPLSHRRGFTNTDYRYENRNNFWCGWQNNGDISINGPLRSGLIGSSSGSNATGIYYPQPMLCNIEFDVDGSMILGIRDRFGDQGGYANYFETGNQPGETYRTLASGEVLRAGNTGNSWVIENNGSVSSAGITTTTPGLADNTPLQLGSFLLQLLTPWGGQMGPGGGYYYYNHNFSRTGVPAPFGAASTNTSHYVKSNGGLAVYPGYNEVLMTAIDPANISYTNGIIRNFNLGSNAGNMSGRMNLINASAGADPSNMGKAAALGDLEILLDAEAMEIGNIVWYDANANGIQDAHETGIAGVNVTLRSPGLDGVYNTSDDQVWTVTTDAGGHYYFDASVVNDIRRPSEWLGVSATNSGILPGFSYRVEIQRHQAALTDFSLTGLHASRNEIDNDGTLVEDGIIRFEINPGGSYAETSMFGNDYNVDFGFYNAVLSARKLEFSALLKENIAGLKWLTTGELNVNKYWVERSLDGQEFLTISSVNSKGNGNFGYTYNDQLDGINAPVVYYRLRIEDKDGSITYSQIVRVNVNRHVVLTVGPNPFVNVLNVQVSANNRTTANTRIVNTAGQVIYRQKLQLEKGTNSFSLNEFGYFPKGMYIVEVEAGTILERQKLMKQ